jgi:hypothetical protein
MTTPSELKEQLDLDSARIAQVLTNTPGGIMLMKKLEAEFDGELFHRDPLQTAYFLGRRDVVVYLRQIIDYSRRAKDELQDETGTI